jgi:hypothetical protein
MGYIPFDREQAESYARALRKQREREAQAAAEAEMRKRLADESIRVAREWAVETKTQKKLRPPKIKTQPSERERGLAALERAVAAIGAHADAEIEALRQGRVRDLVADGRRVRNIDSVTILATSRHVGFWHHPLDGENSSRCLLWATRAVDLLGEEVRPQILYAVRLAATRVRTVARDILRKSRADDRSRVRDFWAARRPEMLAALRDDKVSRPWTDPKVGAD